MKRLNFWTLALLALFLSACAASIKTDVTRFNSLTQPQGESFIILAQNPDRDGSLELQGYATIVSEKLVAQGYRPAGEGKPGLIVTIDFGVSAPLDDGYGSGPYYGYPYYGYSYPYFNSRFYPYHGYGHHSFHSFYYRRHSYFYNTGYYRRVVYERIFELAIKRNQGPVVFEGRAVSFGRSRDLVKIVPFLIEALFTDFPGENGSTVRVSIDTKDEY